MRFSSVVLPLPRNPVRMVTGTMFCSSMGAILLMISRRHLLMALGGALLPLPARAQSPLGVVRELSGEVHLNGFRMSCNSAIQAGQTITTGSDGQIWFTMGSDAGSDAFFLRPDSQLRLESARPREALVDFLRLVSGALGATFQRGAQRRLVSSTSTIGIRG